MFGNNSVFCFRSSTVSVKVSLKDINDNDPTFDRPSYTVTISEATDMNTTILTVEVSAHSVSKINHQGHPTSILGKYLFGRRFEI